MTYWLHEEADAELSEAAAYYAENASQAIAAAFLDEFEQVIALLEVNQAIGATKESGMRILPLRRFPYSLIYREDESAGPQVYAIAHQSRRPGYWRNRL